MAPRTTWALSTQSEQMSTESLARASFLLQGRRLFEIGDQRRFALAAWGLSLGLVVNGLLVGIGNTLDPPELAIDPLQPFLPGVLLLGGLLQIPAGIAFWSGRRDAGLAWVIGAWFAVTFGAEVVGAAAATMTFVSFAYGAGIVTSALFERGWQITLVGLLAAILWVGGLVVRFLVVGEWVGADVPTQGVLLFAPAGWFIVLGRVVAIAVRSAQLTVTRLDRTARQLEKARAAAVAANQAKSVFLASMSHELRTPLNAIIGYSELVIEDPDTSATIIEDVGQVRTAGQHLLGLVNDLLDMSAIEAGKVELELEEIGVEALLKGVLATVEPLVQQSGNTLDVQVERGMRTLWVDVRRLRQVLINLVSNAAKYTENGQICLTARRAGRGVAIDVEDTGPGIEPDRLDEVFEPFVRDTESSTNPMKSGTGLGLTIVRDLATLMGGRVAAQSQVGQGSRFTVWLPSSVPVMARPSELASPQPGK